MARYAVGSARICAKSSFAHWAWLSGTFGAGRVLVSRIALIDVSRCSCNRYLLEPEVEAADVGVLAQLRSRAFHRHAAVLQHVAVIDQGQRARGVLLRDEDRHALGAAQPRDDVEDLADHHRG